MCNSTLQTYSCSCVSTSSFTRCSTYTRNSPCSAHTLTSSPVGSLCALHTLASETQALREQLDYEMARLSQRVVNGVGVDEGVLEGVLEKLEKMQEECDELREFIQEMEALVTAKEEVARDERRKVRGW
ncbi:hypothetical protein MMC30_000121 [Trapelia coarctata]|nr:hypothetical protein [Trapelia coarctata]